jgi:transcriptional regulator with XRE-family HTH domain
VGVPRLRREENAVAALGRRVRALRTAKAWSQERLAEEADMDRSYIAGIEVGARNPSVRALERLARALSVRISDLFEG